MDSNMGNSIFQADRINIDNAGQNLEEAEELEDLKRRQEEIQSLLTKAMDDFNYDDQSTVNSSVNESEFAQQYKEACLDNQLEVMYNIRVKELKVLREKLQAVEQQAADAKAEMVQSLMLIEAENDKFRMTLKNSQELVVEKSIEIENLTHDTQQLLMDNEQLKQALTKLQQEKAAIDCNNFELREKVAILEEGRATNPLSEAVLQEMHHIEVTKLQNSLESCFCTLKRLEKENSTLSEQLSTVISEKDDIVANKTDVINKLMQSVDQAQEHNRELLSNVSHLTAENERFRTHTQELESRLQVMKSFTDKTEIIKILQKELDKSKNLNAKQTIEYEKVNKEYSELLRDYKAKSALVLSLEENLALLERKPMESHAIQTSRLIDTSMQVNELQGEFEHYKRQVLEQDAFEKSLQEKVELLEEDIVNLNKKLELCAQRDSLTIALQEKAARLEERIFSPKPVSESKATNTEQQLAGEALQEVYRTQLETQLIEKEIALRQLVEAELKQYYEAARAAPCAECIRLAKCVEVKEATTQQRTDGCQMCNEMSVSLRKNVELMQRQECELAQCRLNQERDKAAILQLLDDWKLRFRDLEETNAELWQRFSGAQEKLREAEARQAQDTARTWSPTALRQLQEHIHSVRMMKKKIDSICTMTDRRAEDIERNKLQLRLKHSKSQPACSSAPMVKI